MESKECCRLRHELLTSPINILPKGRRLEILSQSLEPLKNDVRLIKSAAGLLSDRPVPPSLKSTNASLKGLTKKPSDHGKKLLALGTALIIAPDPFTGAAAIPVLIAGKMLERRRPIDLKNVYEEMGKSLSSLSSLGL